MPPVIGGIFITESNLLKSFFISYLFSAEFKNVPAGFPLLFP